jgi:uncharacterized protein YbjT (DUF2867 family)
LSQEKTNSTFKPAAMLAAQKGRISKMYLVTGATGNVGSSVVSQLLQSGLDVRVFTRDPGKVDHWADRVQVAVGDFEEPESFVKAVAGVEGIFLMNGGPDGERFQQLMFSAKSQNSPKIVFLSTILASAPKYQIGKLHKDKEDVIREIGLRAAFVRPGGFMSNCYQWIESVRAEGVVYNPMGSGKFAPIAPEDIAAVAVKALTTHRSSDEIYEITGGALLSISDQVQILAEVLGKSIRCVDVPTEIAVQGMIRAGTPAHVAAAVGESLEAIRDGQATMVTDTVARVTGKQPKTFENWARENASQFA